MEPCGTPLTISCKELEELLVSTFRFRWFKKLCMSLKEENLGHKHAKFQSKTSLEKGP